MDTHSVPHEALLRHAGFLRGLARDLVGDAAAAEDLVQEVWVRALERPPRHGSNLRGWLGVVLKNLVRSKARAESRRPARDFRGVVEGESPPPSESEAMLRSVTDAVLALDDPLRETVLQHYFKGLTVAEIARRGSLPISTVKSRLQRAVEVLRTRMDRDQRSDATAWRRALIALTLPEPASPGIPPTGVLVMATGTKLAVACVAVLVAWFAFHELTDTGSRDLTGTREEFGSEAVLSGPQEDAAFVAQRLEIESSTAERSAAGPLSPAGDNSSENEPPQTLIHGTLRDPAGNLLTGLWSAGLNLTDSDGRRRWCDAKDLGSFGIAGLAYGTYWLSAAADGYRGVDEVIELDEEHSQIERNLTLHPKPILKIRVETPAGENFFDAFDRDPPQVGAHLVPVATAGPPGKWLRDVRGSVNNPVGVGQFWHYGPRADALADSYMRILMVDRELPVHVSLVNYQRVLLTQRVGPDQDEVTFVLSMDDLKASCATVRMQVVDAETLAPLEDARGSVWSGTVVRPGNFRSDAQGNLVIEGREPGEFNLRVEAKGYETYRAHVELDSGAVTDVGRVALDRAIRLEVRVVDAEGDPTSAKFTFGILDPSTGRLSMERNARYGCKPGGFVELPDLGRRVYVLRTDNHGTFDDGHHAVPQWVSGNHEFDLRSGSPPVNPTIQLQAATRLVIFVPGEPADGLRFRIVDERGLELVSSRFLGNGPRPLWLPQGTYRVALLDEDRRVLSEKSISVGAEAARLELSR